MRKISSACIYQHASHSLWGSAGLKMPNHANFFRRAILTRQVSQTDLAFGVQSRFVSRCVYARLQVYVCSGYDLFQCG